eukprot:g19353.t1
MAVFNIFLPAALMVNFGEKWPGRKDKFPTIWWHCRVCGRKWDSARSDISPHAEWCRNNPKWDGKKPPVTNF